MPLNDRDGIWSQFLLSWLVGFLIPWSVLVYGIFYPKTPPEGSYCTKAEVCLQVAVLVAVITGVVITIGVALAGAVPTTMDITTIAATTGWGLPPGSWVFRPRLLRS